MKTGAVSIVTNKASKAEMIIMLMTKLNPDMMRADPQWGKKLQSICDISSQEILDAMESLEAKGLINRLEGLLQ